MASIRGIWIFRIFKLKDQVSTEILLSRRFPTVEKRIKRSDGDLYRMLPCDMDICKSVGDELQLSRYSLDFVKEHDTCSLTRKLPVFSIQNGAFSVVVIQKFGLVYAALPEQCNDPEDEFSLSSRCGLAIAYGLIHNIADLATVTSKLTTDGIFEIQQYLMVALPLGTPVEMSTATAKGMLLGKDSAPPPKVKLPAWRPNTGLKHRSTLNLVIKEQIRSIEFNNDEQVNSSEIFGTIYCKADLESSPDVTLFIVAPPKLGVLDRLVYHPCVQLIDSVATSDYDVDAGGNCTAKRLQFRPCIDNFPLCHYRASTRDVNDCPALVYFKLKDETSSIVKVLIQIHFNKDVRGSFEMCNLQIPFYDRGEIRKVDYHPKSANVLLAQDRLTLLWDIGKAIPKSLELSLEAQVEFHKQPTSSSPQQGGVNSDSYVKLTYKLKDYTMSGIRVDTKATTFYPHTKVNVSAGAECSTYDVKIWNGNANVNHIVPGPLRF